MSTVLYLDIETLPALGWDYERRRAYVQTKVPRTHKKDETIAKWITANLTEVWSRTALDPMHGRVYCIGYAINNEVPVVICEENEKDTLDKFREVVCREKYDAFVAHNGNGFDFPFLRTRALKHKNYPLAQTLYAKSRWDERFEDTLEMWPSTKSSSRSMKSILEFLSVDRKDNPIEGKDVYKAYEDGRCQDIIDHCRADVAELRTVHRALALLKGYKS